MTATVTGEAPREAGQEISTSELARYTVGFALEKYVAMRAQRGSPAVTEVFFDFRALAFYAGLIPNLRADVSARLISTLAHAMMAAARSPTGIPGWRIEFDRSGRRARLRCARVLELPEGVSLAST